MTPKDREQYTIKLMRRMNPKNEIQWHLNRVAKPTGIKVLITDEMRAIAEKKAAKIGVLNDSLEKGEGTVAGIIGEQIVLKVINGSIWAEKYDYDLTLRNIRIEVKTKQAKNQPRLEYDCSVSNLNARQKCHVYAFVRVLKDDLSVGWFLGFMSKAEIFKNCIFWKEAERDPLNGFSIVGDCYSVSAHTLYPSVEESLKQFKSLDDCNKQALYYFTKLRTAIGQGYRWLKEEKSNES